MVSSLLGSLLAATASAQATPAAATPPGFAAPIAYEQNGLAQFLRGTAFVAGTGWFEAVGRTLQLRTAGGSVSTVLQAAPGDDLAFLRADGQGVVWTATLLQGTVHRHDPHTQTNSSFAGVPNSFSIALLGGGDVLVSANPTWPAAGNRTGIWLCGPGRTPREILPLSGPSGPILIDNNGNLLVAVIGSAVQLLRIPAAALQQALAGATLSGADADRIGSGWPAIYALATTPDGRLVATSGLDGKVHLVTPQLTAATTPLLELPAGHTALHMQLEAGSFPAPFVAWQPAERAPALLVASSNFISAFAVHRLAPARPQASLPVGGPFAPGPIPIQLEDAPATSFGLLLISPGVPAPEGMWAFFGGAPVWSGLPNATQIGSAGFVTTALGTNAFRLINPGGIRADLTVQCLVFDSSASNLLATSNPLLIPVQP